LCWAVLAVGLSAARAEIPVSGRVVDENNVPVGGAAVSMVPTSPPGPGSRALSAVDGSFSVNLSAPGTYILSVEKDGYFRIVGRPLEILRPERDVAVVLIRARPVFESIQVPAETEGINLDRTDREERLTENQILSVPYPNTHSIRSAMRLMPGVVQDVNGGLHINGASEEQTLFTLDGFNISDPLTGRLESRLSVESARTIELSSGRYSPEYGKGSAGALAIKTSMGDDKLRYSATNFLPGVENHKGLQIGNWTPRLNLSGPISRGRAWFSDSIDAQYDRTVIEELPKGHDRSSSWRMSNLLRSQVNLTPSNILYAGALFTAATAAYAGLGVLTPPETTVDTRSRQWFLYAKDQIYLGRGSLLEIGYAVNRTFGRDIPQGHDMLLITPDGNLGNSFTDATRFGGRDQFLASYFLPEFQWAGTHRIKIGTDLDRVSYRQHVVRTGYENFGDNRRLLRRVVFGGSGSFERSNFEQAGYVQDSWRLRHSLLFELGLRYDRDSLLENNNFAPRFGFGWSPFGLDRMRISGGWGVVYDATNLRIFTRPLDQYSISTYYDALGGIAHGPAISTYWIDPSIHLRSPRYEQFSLSLEQRLPRDLLLRVDWLRKRGRDGFTYGTFVDAQYTPPSMLMARFPNPQFEALYVLRNQRRDVFDSASITMRKSFAGQYELMGSYTRSRALSNAVVDVNVDDPLIISHNVGPMPWDAPNRFLSWGYLPTPWRNWALAFLLDARDGFPFSIYDPSGRVQGNINSLRFPFYFELDLHIERKVVFRGQRWALRGGANNATGRRNPTSVNGNVGSEHFLSYYGGQGRTFNFRIRWLGKARQ